MIQEILLAVNAQAGRTKGTEHQTKTADGSLFFALAFRTESELSAMCKDLGIKT